MIIITNKNIPEAAISRLKNYGKVVHFETKGITYQAISGHPDVFFCLLEKQIIIAPNTPIEIKNELTNYNMPFIEGQGDVGNSYPETAIYNAVVTEKFLIHNLKITDNSIREACSDKTSIHVNQAYTRCNLLALKNDSFITSDKGIYETLLTKKLNVLYVNPQGIILPGFSNGFFGGACGVSQNQIFTIGSLSQFADGEKVITFLEDQGYQTIELYNGPMYDGGSLIFI